MIDLVAGNDRQGYGIQVMLSSDRIPFRRISRASEARGRLLLIATTEIGEDIAALAKSRPALIVGQLPESLAGMFDGVQEKMARHGGCWWCRLPLGETLTTLLTEDYAPHPRQGLAPKWLHGIYYRLFEWMRKRVQRGVYLKLQKKLTTHPDASDYPVDRGGWVLIELLRAMIRQAAGGIVRIERWPAPYQAAATLTHDIEPSKYSYREGLDALLAVARETGHAASLGLVSSCARRYLSGKRLENRTVYCHGLEHRGETVAGPKKQIALAIGKAKLELEELLGREVKGFRSPRLDRSQAMFEVLDESGFLYSSSVPDVDRESMARYGGGVRINLPFRPPIAQQDGGYRASRCLELPVSAPDCVQPLFGGETVQQLQDAVRSKVDFILETGGLYVGIVHAGVFGAADSERRMRHLRFVVQQLERPGLWVASMDEIAAWWRLREQVYLVSSGEGWKAENRGPCSVRDLRFVAEDAAGNIVCSAQLPPIEGGGSLSVGSDISIFNGVIDYATSI